MSNWISRLAQRLADLYYLPTMDGTSHELHPDARRIRSELDAIRMHFPDHA
ncbi:hypothetical protein [Mycolicibacterium vaccae]|uniref:hypothetical protein n=1 Tax=Mycolicibacterium vaccae TaxID=1810 RepID=UPI003D04F565